VEYAQTLCNKLCSLNDVGYFLNPKYEKVIQAVIVEDELSSRNNLKNLLAQYAKDIEIVGEAESIDDAVITFKGLAKQPDVAFLDINLSDGLVFSLLNKLRPFQFEIIFVTAFEEYAVKACEYSSIGYILKPIDPDALKEAIDRIPKNGKNQIEKRLEIFNSHYNNPNVFSKMSIAAVDGIYFVNITDIIRFEAEDNYTHIFLQTGEKITASKTIKAYEELLASYNFYRVHKRHVINLNCMKKYLKGDGNIVIMEDDTHIEVSRRRRASFLEKLRDLQEGN
jgi:two-component system, LytTR family, response regulator